MSAVDEFQRGSRWFNAEQAVRIGRAAIAELEVQLELSRICTRAENRENILLHGKLSEEFQKREEVEWMLDACIGDNCIEYQEIRDAIKCSLKRRYAERGTG